ncbi:hypothetical protein COCNU_scaffold150091G000010 [Cocos nucifera]|nr:hypothetical protein [Cocos nucifera]
MATLSRPPIAPTAAPRIRWRGPIAATADPRKAVPAARGAVIASSGDAWRRWWTPLLRTILREEAASEDQAEAAAAAPEGAAMEATAARRARLTAEKARVLRREMRATEIWHDAMYHSAIASRLASPDQP